MSFLLANGNFQLPGGGPVANGVLTLTLSNPSATVIATGAAATAVYTFTLDANGNLPAGSTVLGNSELTPVGSFYTASLVTSGGTSVPLANNVWVVGPSAPYAGSLFPDVNVYPPISVSGTVSGALSITGNSGLPAASTVNLYMAGNFGSPILGKIYVGDGTGWELDFAKRVGGVDTTVAKITDKGQVLATGVVATGVGAFACAPASFIDGSSGTGGTGGFVVFTNDASTTTGYSAWSTNNAYWNGTSWIQPRGTGTSSHGFAVSHHKNFSFNFATAGGTNNAAITWTEVANIDSGGNIVFSGVARSTFGVAATPAYSFSGDTATGFYRSGAGQVTVAVAGGVGPTFKSTGIQLGADTQFYSLGAAGDTSVSRSAAAVVAIGSGASGSTAGSIALGGATVATTGSIRLANTSTITLRNAANTADLTALAGTSSNTLNIGYNSEINTNGGVTFSSVSASRFTFMSGGTSIMSGRSDGVIGFSATTTPGTNDTAISRGGAAATLAVGNGTAGDFSGTVKAANLNNGGNLAIPNATDTLVARATTDTLTNKRVTPRGVAVADGTSITPNSDASDVVTQTNTQVAGTLTIANPTGTPADGQKLIIRIKTTNSQTYSFGTSYAFSTSVTAPTSIAAGKTDYLGCIWNATNSKWDVVAVDQGH